MEQELVSVIMPTFNAGKILSDSVKCILGQTYTNLELLITDDCSSDNTRSVLQRLAAEDPRVKVEFMTDNRGPGYARNKSIQRAKGRYIAFCDCDDRWVPDKLERQIAFMNEKKCALSFSSYFVVNDSYEEIGIVKAPEYVTFSQMKRDNKIGCLTAVYDVQTLGKKYYMPVIRKRQDWGLLLSILRDCKIAWAIREPLAYYRMGKNTVSSKKLGLIRYNILVYQKVLGYSKLKSHLYFFCLFMPTHLMKLVKRRIDGMLYMRRKNK